MRGQFEQQEVVSGKNQDCLKKGTDNTRWTLFSFVYHKLHL